MESQTFISELEERTNKIVARVEQLKTFKAEQLNAKASQDKWSALETIEHLNLYGDFYNPEISKRLKGNNTTTRANYKGNWLGNYFVKTLEPRPIEKMNSMKTFKDKNPNGSDLDSAILDRFLDQQKVFLELLNQARKVDLKKNKHQAVTNF